MDSVVVGETSTKEVAYFIMLVFGSYSGNTCAVDVMVW